MMQLEFFAQATGAPNNGASNAADFQPPTQNPQNGPVDTQQQSSGIQDASGQQLLNDANQRILVPKNPADPAPTQTVSAGFNWPLVVVVTFVLVVAIELLIRKREKRPFAEPSNSTAEEVVELLATESPVSPAPSLVPKPAQKSSKKPTKKKSKSKRKKK